MGLSNGLINQFDTILGSLFGALVGAFTGAYLQRRFDYKRQKRREIYRPLFNEVSEAMKGKFPKDSNDRYESKWDGFSEYKKYDVPDGIAEKFDLYSDKISKYWKADMRARPTDDQTEEIAALLNQKFPDELLKKKERGVTGVVSEAGGGTLPVGNMLDMFGDVWFSVDGPDELRRELLAFADANHGGHADRYRAWDGQYPDWNNALWELIQELDYEDYSDFRRRAELFDDIRTHAKDLREALKSKVTGVL